MKGCSGCALIKDALLQRLGDERDPDHTTIVQGCKRRRGLPILIHTKGLNHSTLYLRQARYNLISSLKIQKALQKLAGLQDSQHEIKSSQNSRLQSTNW